MINYNPGITTNATPAICKQHELLNELFELANGPFNVNQLQMAKSLLEQESEPLPKESFGNWLNTAIYHRDLPLIQLLFPKMGLTSFLSICNSVDHREPIFEEILSLLSRKQSDKDFKISINFLILNAIIEGKTERFEYLLNFEAFQPIVKNELSLFLFSSALKAENPQWIQMLIDKVDKIPLNFLKTLFWEGRRELFDQVIKKATWDHEAIQEFFNRLAETRKTNPNNQLLVEKAYYIAKIEEHFGPREQGR